MSKVFRGEEHAMYLFKESPLPLVDCFMSAVAREEKRRKVPGKEKLDHVGVAVRIYPYLLIEMVTTGRLEYKTDNTPYFEGYRLIPFISVNAGETFEFFVFMDYQEGKMYGF